MTSLQDSCLENPMNGGAWQAAVHGVTKSRTQLSDFTFTFHFHALEKEMATHSSVLAGESQGWGSLVGFHLWGRTESDTTEATQQQQHPINTKSNKMNQNVINFFLRQKFIRFLKYIYNIYIYVYKGFSTMLEKENQKRKRNDGDIGKTN